MTAKEAIVEYCRENRPSLSIQFTAPLTDEEYEWTLDEANWIEMDDEDDPDDVRGFDCEPFDDQLRAYVKVDASGNPINLVVQGE